MNAVGKLEVGTLDITKYSNRVPAEWTMEAGFVVRERDDYKRWHGEQLDLLRTTWDKVHDLRRDLATYKTRARGWRIIAAVLALGHVAILLNTYFFGA